MTKTWKHANVLDSVKFEVEGKWFPNGEEQHLGDGMFLIKRQDKEVFVVPGQWVVTCTTTHGSFVFPLNDTEFYYHFREVETTDPE